MTDADIRNGVGGQRPGLSHLVVHDWSRWVDLEALAAWLKDGGERHGMPRIGVFFPPEKRRPYADDARE